MTSDMKQVSTVGGPVSVDSLGMTLPHEHLVFGMTGWELDILPNPGFEERVDRCEPFVRAAYEAGVRTMVELSTPEMGRDVAVMKELTSRIGMQIVCATGLYSRHSLSYFMRRSVDEIAELFVHELVEGIGDTGVKAGMIKCATEGAELTDYEKTAMKAAVQAQLQTGVPITVHVEPGGGLAAARFLLEQGAAADRVVIAHAEGSKNIGELETIAGELGAYVGFDRFGYEITVSNKMRIGLIGALLHVGLVDRILLSHDFVCVLHGRDAQRWAGMEDALTNWNFTYLSTTVLPELAEVGVTESEIHTMTVLNPARMLAGVAS